LSVTRTGSDASERGRAGLPVVEELRHRPGHDRTVGVRDQAAARQRDRVPGTLVLRLLGVVVDPQRETGVILDTHVTAVESVGECGSVEDVVYRRHVRVFRIGGHATVSDHADAGHPISL
jgi:hypothetical protein